jgi:hypothetical protein
VHERPLKLRRTFRLLKHFHGTRPTVQSLLPWHLGFATFPTYMAARVKHSCCLVTWSLGYVFQTASSLYQYLGRWPEGLLHVLAAAANKISPLLKSLVIKLGWVDKRQSVLRLIESYSVTTAADGYKTKGGSWAD